MDVESDRGPCSEWYEKVEEHRNEGRGGDVCVRKQESARDWHWRHMPAEVKEGSRLGNLAKTSHDRET